jgi:hypothetical protein
MRCQVTQETVVHRKARQAREVRGWGGGVGGVDGSLNDQREERGFCEQINIELRSSINSGVLLDR